MADEYKMAASPRAAATAWVKLAVSMASTETRPAVRPWLALRAVIYNTAGPGTSSRASAATTNRYNRELSIIRFSITSNDGHVGAQDGRRPILLPASIRPTAEAGPRPGHFPPPGRDA